MVNSKYISISFKNVNQCHFPDKNKCEFSLLLQGEECMDGVCDNINFCSTVSESWYVVNINVFVMTMHSDQVISHLYCLFPFHHLVGPNRGWAQIGLWCLSNCSLCSRSDSVCDSREYFHFFGTVRCVFSSFLVFNLRADMLKHPFLRLVTALRTRAVVQPSEWWPFSQLRVWKKDHLFITLLLTF